MPVHTTLKIVFLCAIAGSAMAQDKPKKSTAVQQDPILVSVQSQDPEQESALSLPSDPQDKATAKVQEDPLLHSFSESDDSKEKTDGQALVAPMQQDHAPKQGKVQDDSILATTQDQPSPPKSPPVPKSEKSDTQDRVAPDPSRLVPKPKDTSVQEDPLLRTIPQR